MELVRTGVFNVKRRPDWKRTLYGDGQPPTWTFCTADRIHICDVGGSTLGGYPLRCTRCGRTRYGA